MAEETQHPAEPNETAREPREQRDLSFRVVAGFGIGLLVLLGVLSLILMGLYSYLSIHSAKSDVLPSMVTPQLPPEPRLEVVPADTLAKLRATEDALLNSYAWVDQKNGIVRIPITQAMSVLARRGLPTSPPAKSANGQFLEF